MASEQPALEQVRSGEPGVELEWEEGAYSARDRLAKLARKKDETETAVALAQRYLETTPVGLRGSLIDAEGFPKDGLDHYAIRQARHTIDCGKHDLRRINDRMLDLLVTAQQEGGTSGSTSPMTAGAKASSAPAPQPRPANTVDHGRGDVGAPAQREQPAGVAARRPIFRVAAVSAGSPAAEAGLHVGDLVTRFGDVTASDLHLVAALVRARANEQVPLELHRGAAPLSVILVPRAWSGTGLLGCVLSTETS
jgi:26S proteasome non-ATPase regulatory subunit 9